MSLNTRAKVLSFINLKGGVGKTTCAVNVAATMAARKMVPHGSTERAPKILFIDTDPQANATLTLLNREEYASLEPDSAERGKTIFRPFHQLLKAGTDDRTPALSEIVYAKKFHTEVSTAGTAFKEAFEIDVIPSSLNLFDLQDELARYRSTYRSATGILEDCLNGYLKEARRQQYTHIIIDCPPSLGLVTQNVLTVTDYLLIPVFLDAYSHWGLDKISERLQFIRSRNAGCSAEILGVVYSKYETEATVMNRIFEQQFKEWVDSQMGGHLRQTTPKEIPDRFPFVFNSRIQRRDVIRKAEAENSALICYNPTMLTAAQAASARHQRNLAQPDWTALVEEILHRIHRPSSAE